MKKLLLASLAIALLIINHKSIVAIPLKSLESENYIMVLAKDSTTPIMLSLDIIKKSKLLSDMVKQMTSKRELGDYAKHKLQVKYKDLLIVKDLTEKNKKIEYDTFSKETIDSLTDIVNVLNYLGYSGDAFFRALISLKAKVDGLHKKVTTMWRHWDSKIPDYEKRILHHLEDSDSEKHDGSGHDDYNDDDYK